MLLFAVLFFTLMIDAGLFDPLSNAMIRFAKGDPLKVMLATVILSAGVSLNGDGTTTMIIVCSAFVPIYKKLKMRKIILSTLLAVTLFSCKKEAEKTEEFNAVNDSIAKVTAKPI